MTLELQGKNGLVLGLGDTGLSLARWLDRHGARVTVADSRAAPPHAARLGAEVPAAALVTGPYRQQEFDGADFIAISPGVPLAEPLVAAAVARGVPVAGDIELFAQAIPAGARVLAITGSNGKSTVTEMVGAMCRKAGMNTVVAGNIGLPVLDALSEAERNGALPDVWVLELSSFQLETTRSLRASAATVLNVSSDHMDRYGSFDEYAAAKARIFSGSGIQVLNLDDAVVMTMVRQGMTQQTFGLDTGSVASAWGVLEREGRRWLAKGHERLFLVDELPVAGLHNAANALAALALCRALDIPYEPLLAALREFRGLSHRVEKVAEINGVTYYDDSKGTNVGATAAALSGMPGKVVLIAGGDGKGQDFRPLRAVVAQHARAVLLIGRDAPLIRAVLEDCGVPLHGAATLEEAVAQAARVAQPGDAVLLSPACASWDMFRNYAHRAEVFIAAVRRLEQGGQP
jgi:UDP-N-acetylmuramoylalanine--D-glutamate ligase